MEDSLHEKFNAASQKNAKKKNTGMLSMQRAHLKPLTLV